MPVDGLTLGASMGYQKARYLEFFTDIDGNGTNEDASFLKLRNVPKITANVTANYEFPPAAWGPGSPLSCRWTNESRSCSAPRDSVDNLPPCCF